jgi:hypothetical protein
MLYADFISGLRSGFSLALSSNNLFVRDSTTGIIGKYDAVTGAAINPNLVTVDGGFTGYCCFRGQPVYSFI